MRNRTIGSLATVVVVLSLLAVGPASAATNPVMDRRPAPAAGGPRAPAVTILAQPGQAYIHTSTLANTSITPDSSYLDNPALNGQPNTKFFAVNNGQPYGYGPGTNNRPLGVWYDSGAHRWAIYNDDQATMAQQLAWNVFIPPQDGTVIVHTSSGANSNGPLTHIDDSQFNDNPNAVIFVQHVYNPGAPAAGAAPLNCGCDYYTRTVAVTYDAGAQKWAIRNADGSAFPPGITFNALKASSDETVFTHTVTAGSLTLPLPYGTALDSPLLNGNPDAQILVTQNYGAGLANDHRVSIGYYAPNQRWYIVNDDAAAMQVGLMFNVLVIPPKIGYMLQEATPDNTGGNAVFVGDGIHPNPNLDGNPDALIYVTHNWNPPESNNGIYNDHPLGVQYIHGLWAIVNLDGAFMQQGLTFNVYYTWPRGNSFSVSASSDNTSASSMTINSPLLNGNPSAVALTTFNATPAGQTGVITYTTPTGLRYYSPLSAWQVFNPSGPTFNITQTYNVLVPNVAASFVVTGTASAFDNFFIDNPLTNGNPRALVFATPRDSGGINQKNIGVYWQSGAQRWAIFNEDQSNMTASTYDVFVVQRVRLFLPTITK